MSTMDSGVSACSQESVVEGPDSTHYRKSLGTEGLEAHQFWSSAKAEGLGLPPPYTDGPSRVILADDGTKDCLALLLTPDLVAALNQTTHDMLALQRKLKARERIKMEIVDLSCKLGIVEEIIRNARYRDRAEEMQLALEILQLKQQEAKEGKNQLNTELAPIETSLKMSRHQSQGILQKALLEACLIDPPEPGSPSLSHDVEEDASAGDSADAPRIHEGIESGPEQQSLRDARLDVAESYDALRASQARFDDRQADYEQKLAHFQRSTDGSKGTRTHFDHQHLRHVQTLTRHLLTAEREHRAARANVRALEPPADPGKGDEPGAGIGTGVDVPAESGTDRARIEAWARGVSPEPGAETVERREPDDWDARPVEVGESLSALDREEYVDEISDWKERCRVLREASSGLWRQTDGL